MHITNTIWLLQIVARFLLNYIQVLGRGSRNVQKRQDLAWEPLDIYDQSKCTLYLVTTHSTQRLRT